MRLISGSDEESLDAMDPGLLRYRPIFELNAGNPLHGRDPRGSGREFAMARSRTAKLE
jgi:hypothetical protein